MRRKIGSLLFICFFWCSVADARALDDELINAVDRKDVMSAQELIHLGADVDARDGLGFPVLMTAARRGSLALVKLLIDNGADVDLEAQDPYFIDFSGATALMWAAEDGHLDIVEFLLDNGADVYFWSQTFIPTALLRAAVNGRTEVVRSLLDHGADVEQSVDGKTALFFAAREGDEDTVRLLLDYGADVHAKQREVIFGPWRPKGQEKLLYVSSILMQAAQEGNYAVMHMLLDKGAKVNEVDSCGVSPLMFAVYRGHTEVARLLLNEGAAPNIKAFKRKDLSDTLCGKYPETTALVLSARYSHATEIARMLLAKGADINSVDDRGWTALMHACDKGYTDMVRLFLQKGAKVNIKSGPYTALFLAGSHDYGEIVSLLRKAGAK